MIDTCLDVLYGKRWATLGKAVLRIFAEGYLDYLDSLNPDTDDSLNDLHTLFGSVCAFAEL